MAVRLENGTVTRIEVPGFGEAVQAAREAAGLSG
jgi:hypothetical protein